MTLRYLLDTNIVSIPVWKEPDSRVLNRLSDVGAECAISSPVWQELTFGCSRMPKGKRRNALEAYLRDVVRKSFPILPYDEEAAAWHGAERARLEAAGQPAPFVDGQIAAIARVHDLILVTANERDFKVFQGLTLENWTTHPRKKARR
jgi:tRNA(fMet)-specific endonuclease VapC